MKGIVYGNARKDLGRTAVLFSLIIQGMTSHFGSQLIPPLRITYHTSKAPTVAVNPRQKGMSVVGDQQGLKRSVRTSK